MATTEHLHRCSFPPGTVIFREGEVGDCAYVIEQGRVEISALRGSRRVVLSSLGEGELFGEIALLDGQVRTATATTLAATTLVLIRRDQVHRKISGADPVLRLFLKVILHRLRSTSTLFEPGSGVTPPPPTQERTDESMVRVRSNAISQLQLEHGLEEGLERQEYRLHYQPIIDLGSGLVAGFEALLRWQHPRRGLLSPAEFIEPAERTGLIVPIGRWVLGEAASRLHTLQQHLATNGQPERQLFMGVNLSVRQIVAEGIVEQVREVIEGAGIRPQALKLEITESVLMEQPDTAITVLNRLKALGTEIAIDDFGTGYSSLSYLHRFPIDVLKIDRCFVTSLLSDSASRKIVRSITTLAKELGLRVVAEGVELPQEVAVLRELGCDYGQGFLFAKPLLLERAEQTLDERLLEPAAPSEPVQ